MKEVCALYRFRFIHIIRNSTEKHTSQAVVICVVVHQGERPPGNEVVGSRAKHGTHGCLCSIFVIPPNGSVTPSTMWCADGGQ